MNKLIVSICAVAALSRLGFADEPAEGTWRYSPAAENQYNANCITDGNWWLKVTDWSANGFGFGSNFSTVYKAGSGKLDFAKAEADLGKSWLWYDSRGLSGLTTMTEFVFPARCNKLCASGFSGCTNLERVSGGGAFTSIPNYWVAGCSKMAALDLNFTNVTAIGTEAFRGCSVPRLEFPGLGELTANYPFSNVNKSGSGIREFYAPALTNITGKWVFGGCAKLETVVLSSNIVNLGEGTFASCKALRTVTPSRFYAYAIIGDFMRDAATNYEETVTLYGDDPAKDGTGFGLSFYSSGVPKVDMTDVMQNVTIMQTFKNATRLEELRLGPCMTNLTDQGGSVMFPSTLKRMYFTGYAPRATGTFFDTSKVSDYQVRAYVDPKFDKGWKVGTLSRSRALTSGEIELLDQPGYEDVKAEYQKGNLLGTWTYALYGKRLWLIKWQSPHRKIPGLMILLK